MKPNGESTWSDALERILAEASPDPNAEAAPSPCARRPGRAQVCPARRSQLAQPIQLTDCFTSGIGNDYPFWIFGKNVHEKADKAEGEETPGRPLLTTDEAERQRLVAENDRLRRELERGPPAGGGPVVGSGGSDGPGVSRSIAQELAALERSLGAGTPAPEAAPVPRRGSREARDEDGDGRLDHLLLYDANDRLSRSEEDLDGDGRLESVTIYEAGEVVRKRVDTDGDGNVDSWSFFGDGKLERHEVDRDADGFRDLVMIYADGELLREEEDRNGDGRADLTLYYADGDVVERHEDVDFDGVPDVLSFYERGKLVRREVRSEGLLEPGTAP